MTRALRRWWRSTTAIALFFEVRIAGRRLERSVRRFDGALMALAHEKDRAHRLNRVASAHLLFTLHGRGR